MFFNPKAACGRDGGNSLEKGKEELKKMCCFVPGKGGVFECVSPLRCKQQKATKWRKNNKKKANSAEENEQDEEKETQKEILRLRI